MSSDAHCDAHGVQLSALSVARALDACLRPPSSIDARLRSPLSDLLNALAPHFRAQLDPAHNQSLADIAALASSVRTDPSAAVHARATRLPLELDARGFHSAFTPDIYVSLVQNSMPDLLSTRYASTFLQVLTSLSALFHCLEAFFHAPISTTDPLTALSAVPTYDSQPQADAKVPAPSADRYIALLSAHRSFLTRLQRIALPTARIHRLQNFAATLTAQRRLNPDHVITQFTQPTFSYTHVMASNEAAHTEYALLNLYNANNKICSTAVALKFFRVTDNSRQHYFGQEALRLRTLSHPCIPLFHGVFANFHRHVSESRRVVVASERMTCNLRTAKFLPALSTFQARLKVLRDIASALAFLHSSRVYHAAVRPENVLLRVQGKSIYGVAKLDVTCLLRRALQLTAARPKIYEPPELFSAEHYTYYTGDIWSFGVLATFLMTVYSSEDEDDNKYIANAIRSGLAYPARDWAKSIRHTLIRELVVKCLVENPAERLTAVQLVKEIDQIQRIYSSKMYCDTENDRDGKHTLGDVTGAERRANGTSNPKSCSGPSCNGCTFCSREGRGSYISRRNQQAPRGVVSHSEGDAKQAPGVKEEPSRLPVVGSSRLVVKVEPNEVGAERSSSHRSSRRRKRRRLLRHISSDDENDELYGYSNVNSIDGLESNGNGEAVPLFEDLLMDTGLAGSLDSRPIRIRKRRRSQQNLGTECDYSFDRNSGLLSKLDKRLTQAPPALFASIAKPSAQPSQPAQQPIPNTCAQNRTFSNIPKPSPSAGFGHPRSSASKEAEVNIDAEKRSGFNLQNKVQKAAQAPCQFARDLDSGTARVPTKNADQSSFPACSPAMNANGKSTTMNIVQRQLPANQPSPVQAETRFSTPFPEVGDYVRESLADEPNTRVSFDMVQNIVQLHSKGQQRQETPVMFYTADDVMNTFGQKSKETSGQEGDNKNQSISSSAKKKRRRSCAIDVKMEGQEQTNEEKRKDQKEEKYYIKTEGSSAPSNSPWAGRMRKRTQRRYSEEAPIHVSDTDSIDFVNGGSEPSSIKETKAKTPVSEKTPFIHLISITDKNFKQLSQSLAEHGQQDNVGIQENSYSIINDDVDSVYALGVIKGSRSGLDPFQYFKREATRGDTTAKVRLGILYEKGAGGQQDLNEAFYYYSDAASKDDSEGQLRLGRCYEEGRGVPRNESTAVTLYLAAAKKNHPIAHYKVAKCFLEGRGLKRDVKKAAAHFEEAVKGHILEAAVSLADIYKEGKDISQDFSKAFLLYRSAANSSSVSAKVKLAHCYAKGNGCRRSIPKAIELYKEASDHGDPDAKLSLGLLYEDGNGVKASCERALKFYAESAFLGHGPGVTALGQCYLWGYGVPKDFAKAKSLFEVAAEKGDALAMHELGNCYRDGNGCEKDMKKAVSYYSMASAKGSPVALVEYGECYYYGKVVGIDYDKAFKLFSKAAELGAAEGYRWVADCYTDGSGTEKDYKKAVQLHRKAVDLGSSVSQLCLGNLYENGLGVEKNKTKALNCYRKAAEQGNFTALNNLGILYEKGELVKRDYKRAVSYYEQAKDLGCIDAVCNLADCYTAGNGVPRNYDIAFKLYQEAASSDLPGAVCEMGVCYYQGRGVQQNFAKALEAFNKVKDEEPEAVRQLGVIHYDGRAMQRDFQKAIEYYRKSIDMGNTNAYLSLAICFLNGEGVQKNEEYAVELVQKAADGGNRMAFMYLGNCYFEGRGVTKDSQKALLYYRKGQDADPMLS